jgi:hypothetical protein
MADAYDSLIETGFMGRLKRDIVLEASRDLEYLVHLRREFECASAESAEEATACTVRVTQELIAQGLCSLATWGESGQEYEVVEKSAAELIEIVDKSTSEPGMSFAYFLIATKRGEEWVARYDKLVSEL